MSVVLHWLGDKMNNTNNIESERNEENVLKMLSNPVRATIVRSLYKDNMSFTHLMQITGCNTGKLSFHLGKLGSLVQQDELKRYTLSDKGMAACEAILPRIAGENGEKHDSKESCADVPKEDSISGLATASEYAVARIVGIYSAITGFIMHLANGKSPVRIAAGNINSLIKGVKQMISWTINYVRLTLSDTLKSAKLSLNPIFSYFFLIAGILLFMPAVFVSVSPGFDSLVGSIADADRSYSHISANEMAQANNLYEAEMLPNQQNYEGDYNFTAYDSMNYINVIGYPLTEERVQAWRNDYKNMKVQFINDIIFAALSVSLAMMLTGGLLSYRKGLFMKRAVISAIVSSVLLIMVSAVMLYGIDVLALSNFSQGNRAIIPAIAALLRAFTGILVLAAAGFSGTYVYLNTKDSTPARMRK